MTDPNCNNCQYEYSQEDADDRGFCPNCQNAYWIGWDEAIEEISDFKIGN